MKAFAQPTFDRSACLTELAEFKQLLDSTPEIDEKSGIQPLFKRCINLSLMISLFYTEIIEVDKYAFEFPIYGDFVSDLVLLDSKNSQMLLVEFEDAKNKSIFEKNGEKVTLEWAKRIEHGYSQIVDWLWKLSDMELTRDFENKFGRNTKYQSLLIIGRDTSIPSDCKNRFEWRFEKSIINSKYIKCMTYDELYRMINRKMWRADYA